MNYSLLVIPILLVATLAHGFDIFGIFGGSDNKYRPDARGEEGECSHWGGDFPFRTETGELYDADDLIARHRTLPIGSYATVTNLRTRQSVVVRITGRGPNIIGRIMDLSPAAFGQISDISEAVIDCSVRAKMVAPPPPPYPSRPGYDEGPRPSLGGDFNPFPSRPGYDEGPRPRPPPGSGQQGQGYPPFQHNNGRPPHEFEGGYPNYPY